MSRTLEGCGKSVARDGAGLLEGDQEDIEVPNICFAARRYDSDRGSLSQILSSRCILGMHGLAFAALLRPEIFLAYRDNQ